jgi:hypothetical protein
MLRSSREPNITKSPELAHLPQCAKRIVVAGRGVNDEPTLYN